MTFTQQSRRVAIVTGGGSGFGAATARKFASLDIDVVVADIAEENGKAVVAEIKAAGVGQAIFVKMDVTDRAAWETMVEATLESFGQINFMINNAGGSYKSKPVLETTCADFYKCINLNLYSIFHSVHTVIPHLKRAALSGQPGVMVNIASTGGLRPRPGLTWYSASKAACISVTSSLAIEFAPDRIRVNCVCPVLSPTPLMDSFIGSATVEDYQKSIPLGRLATPQDIANAVVHFCSDEADFQTGVVLPVDGGRCA